MSTSQEYVSAQLLIAAVVPHSVDTTSAREVIERLQEKARHLATEEAARSRITVNLIAILDQMGVCSVEGDRGITEKVASVLMQRFTITEEEEQCPF